jgi:hypothetical protein
MLVAQNYQNICTPPAERHLQCRSEHSRIYNSAIETEKRSNFNSAKHQNEIK